MFHVKLDIKLHGRFCFAHIQGPMANVRFFLPDDDYAPLCIAYHHSSISHRSVRPSTTFCFCFHVVRPSQPYRMQMYNNPPFDVRVCMYYIHVIYRLRRMYKVAPIIGDKLAARFHHHSTSHLFSLSLEKMSSHLHMCRSDVASRNTGLIGHFTRN